MTDSTPDFADAVALVLNWQAAESADPEAQVLVDHHYASHILGNLVALCWSLAVSMADGDTERAAEILMAFGRAYIDTTPPDGAE